MVDDISIMQWIILSVSALLIGMSKTGVQGVTLLAIPFLALSFGAKESTGIVLPMLCFADIMAVTYYRRSASWKSVIKLLPTAIVGFFVAIAVDAVIPKDSFRQLMGITLALALCILLFSEISGKNNRFIHHWWYSAFFGLLGGFTTMIGNAAGPVMSVYLLSMRKEKTEYIGINAWFFLIVNLLKVPLQVLVWKNIQLDTFVLDVLMIPLLVVGALLGIVTVKMFNEQGFRKFIMLVTIISVIIMIIG